MNDDAAKQLIAYMAGTWRAEFTEAQVAVWRETFEDVKPAHAREALRALKGVKTFVPSHAEFFEAVEVIIHREAAQHEEVMAGEAGGTACPDCGDTNWIPGVGGVARCPRCNPEPPTRNAVGSAVEHKPHCSCSRWVYGPRRLAMIRSGRDGLGPRKDRSLDDETGKAHVDELREQLAKVGRDAGGEF